MPTEPTSQKILANLVSTLGAIEAGDTYWTTVRNAFVGDASAVSDPVTPAAYVIPYTTDMDGEGRTLTQSIRHILTLDVRLVLETRDADAARQFERYIADAIKAIYVDRTRGGNAVHTIVEDVDRSYPDGDRQNTYLATLSLRIPFRTTPDDLGSSF